VPVAEGGGECDLANMRTLCLKCHRAATAALLKRRALTSPPPQSKTCPAPSGRAAVPAEAE
jgi:hypothetical protein